MLNVEDSQTVSYALRKLTRLRLIEGQRSGKETLYATSAEGKAACARYRQVREDCLISALEAFARGEADNREIGEAAGLMRALSGLYDQASRGAASL